MFEFNGKHIPENLAELADARHAATTLRDCVGSRSRELHELALKLMEQTHFDIATAAEIAALWPSKE